MAAKFSTGLRNKMLDNGSFKATMALGFIKIYGSASAPASADDAVPGGATLLCTISNNSTGTGINMAAAAASGAIPKLASETWSGVNAATGVALWFRHVAVGDDGTLSTTQARVQGAVGTAGAELNLSNTTLTSAATQTITSYSVALPTF
jgi:hypothetical protein